jgi:hypothetical protein
MSIFNLGQEQEARRSISREATNKAKWMLELNLKLLSSKWLEKCLLCQMSMLSRATLKMVMHLKMARTVGNNEVSHQRKDTVSLISLLGKTSTLHEVLLQHLAPMDFQMVQNLVLMGFLVDRHLSMAHPGQLHLQTHYLLIHLLFELACYLILVPDNSIINPHQFVTTIIYLQDNRHRNRNRNRNHLHSLSLLDNKPQLVLRQSQSKSLRN